MRFSCLVAIPAWLILPGSAWAQGRSWEWHGDINPVWWPFIGLAVGVAVLLLLGAVILHLAPLILGIIAAVLGVRWLVRNTRGPRSDAAVAILRERYARGEITKEEFDARLSDLGGPR